MCYDRRGGPRTLSKTADANLDCAFVESALVFVVLKIGKDKAPPFPLPPSETPLIVTTSNY